MDVIFYQQTFKWILLIVTIFIYGGSTIILILKKVFPDEKKIPMSISETSKKRGAGEESEAEDMFALFDTNNTDKKQEEVVKTVDNENTALDEEDDEEYDQLLEASISQSSVSTEEISDETSKNPQSSEIELDADEELDPELTELINQQKKESKNE